MGFLVGLIIGSGLFLIFRVYLHPHPVHITHAIRTRIKTRVLPAVAAAITGGFMAWLITSSTPISACIAALSAVLPGAWTGARERRRSREIREAWPEALDDVVNSLRAGVSMSEALSLLAIRGPEIMRPAFTQYAAHARATGRLIPALEELQDELADPMADRILEAMNRPYRTEGFGKAVGLLRDSFEDPALTTDVIVGFPGETEDDFEQSLAFCQDMAFSRIHVFRYSERKNTRAARLPDKVSGPVASGRSQQLIQLAGQLSISYQ
ncbi:MAG: hypothetical protein GX483_03935, partial [Actinomycetaceae bacterium]|nr:hypothetical protein [Actinomycetaceae bacterium]